MHALVLCATVAAARADAARPGEGGGALDYRTWGAVVDTLRDVETGRRLTLAHAFLVPASDTVLVAGATLARNEYRIDYHMGTLRIDTPVPPGSVAVVRYQRQPVMLAPMYSLRPAEAAPHAERAPPARATTFEKRPAEQTLRNLSFGGTKSVSFTVGSDRGTSLDQTLQATIEGNVTPTIKVRALLSDNNLPVQPEGNTETLEYFDQVFIEIEGTRARATLGDFSFTNTMSSFSPVTRQLKGISASAWREGTGRVTAAGATSKGVFRTAEFRGTTGLQGPYELLSASRNTLEVIIAGTERVFVDGIAMQRGQNQDYVIDYDRGSITFTPRRLITNDTEIAVDFEVTQERYARSTILGAVEDVALGGGTRLRVLAAQESDDREQPRNQSFTPEEIAVLEAAGDDPDAAITGGVSVVPVGEGEYVLVPADTVAGTPATFVFDDTTGTYLVSFIEVAAGEGDYELGGISTSGRRYYRYAGAGLGNYVVGKRLPLPESVRLVAARVVRERDRGLTLDAEWNTSAYDRNLFSSQSDGDNVGHAGRARVGYAGIPVGLGRLGLALGVSALDERFKSFDRARPRFFYRDWNLENMPLEGREVITEAEAEVARGERAALRYTLSRLSRKDPGGDIEGAKHEGRLLVGRIGDRGVAVRALDSSIDRPEETRTRRHLRAEASLAAWKVVPTVVYGAERYHEDAPPAEPDSGIAYELVGARLSNRNQERFALSLDVERRDTEETNSRTDGWRDTRRDETVTAGAAARGLGGIQGEIQLTRRVETDRFTGARTDTDLGRLKSTIRGDRAGILSDVDYEISRTAARTLERSVVFVGEGNGDYNAQGDLVGKGKGAYTVVYSPTTTSVPIRRVGLNFRFVWRAPERARGGGMWAWIADNVALDQTIGVQEESSHEPAWELYLMLPSALQRDDATLFGSTRIRQDWTLLRSRRNLGLVFRYRREDTEDNRFEGVRENRFFGEHALRLSRSLSRRLTGTVELSRTADQRDGEGVPEATGAAYDVTALTLLGGVGVRVGEGSTIDIDLKATNQEDAISSAAQTLLAFQPRVIWRVGERINVFASYDFTQTWDRVTAPVRPVRFSDEGAAHRWNVTPNLRLARVISIVAAYSGRSETTFGGTRVTRHELRLETRAIF